MVAFAIGSIKVYRYGIFYLVTFLLGYLFLWKVGKSKLYAAFPGAQRLLTKGVDDIILATIIGILIGGRAGEVLLYNRDYYSTHLTEIFAVRHGGMSFIGGIAGVIVSIFILDRISKLTRKEFFIIFDLLLVVVPVGIILGRYGNFLNQELYGIVAPSRIPGFLTHIYPAVDQIPRINTNLLALLLEGVLIFVVTGTMFLKQYTMKKIKPGRITVAFILLYSLIRFVLEYLRADSQSQFMGPFTTTQRCMIFFFAFGIAIRRLSMRRAVK